MGERHQSRLMPLSFSGICPFIQPPVVPMKTSTGWTATETAWLVRACPERLRAAMKCISFE